MESSITLGVPKQVKENITIKAKQEGLDRASYIRRLLIKHLEKKEEKNDRNE